MWTSVLIDTNWPNSQIPECSFSISHNAPFTIEMCTFLVLRGALWDMEEVHSEICEIGLLMVRPLSSLRWRHTSVMPIQITRLCVQYLIKANNIRPSITGPLSRITGPLWREFYSGGFPLKGSVTWRTLPGHDFIMMNCSHPDRFLLWLV